MLRSVPNVYEPPADCWNYEHCAELCVALQRILSVEYTLPAHAVVTPECRDLLSQILVADPARRISLSDLQRHPWFRRDLPEEMASMNARLLANPSSYRSSATQVCIAEQLLHTPLPHKGVHSIPHSCCQSAVLWGSCTNKYW